MLQYLMLYILFSHYLLLHYLLVHYLMLHYVNVAPSYMSALMLGYSNDALFGVALYDGALFTVALLNVVPF